MHDVRRRLYQADIGTHDVFEDKGGEQPLQLSDSPDAARAHHAAIRQVLQPRPVLPLLDDQRIHRVLPLQHARDLASGRELRRHVLHGVHEHVDLTLEQRDLELLRPECLPAEQVQRLRLVLVPARGHEGGLEGCVGVRGLQGIAHGIRLDPRELGRAGGESELERCARGGCWGGHDGGTGGYGG